MRPTSKRARLYAWVAPAFSAQNTPRRNGVLLVLTLFVFLLGFWGWLEIGRDENPGSSPGMAIALAAYQSIQLFVFENGEVAQPPVSQQIARFLAPVLTGSYLYSLFGKVESRLQRSAARASRNHTVAVGPHSKVEPVLAALKLPEPTREPIVRVAPAEDATIARSVHTGVDVGEPEWIKPSSLARARHVVIACQEDGDNLDTLNDILANTSLDERLRTVDQEGPTLEAFVAVHNRSLALRTTLRQCVVDARRAIEIICPEDIAMRRAVEEITKRSDAGHATPIVIVGGGQLSGLALFHMHRHLVQRHLAGPALNAHRILLLESRLPERRLSRYRRDESRVVVQQVNEFELEESRRVHKSLVVLMAHADVATNHAHSYEWACQHPLDLTWYLTDRELPGTGASRGLPLPIRLATKLQEGLPEPLDGPMTIMTRSRLGDADISPSEWASEMTITRVLIAGLARHADYWVAPSDASLDAFVLPNDAARSLVAGAAEFLPQDISADETDKLVEWIQTMPQHLERVDLTVHGPSSNKLYPGRTDGLEVDRPVRSDHSDS